MKYPDLTALACIVLEEIEREERLHETNEKMEETAD